MPLGLGVLCPWGLEFRVYGLCLKGLGFHVLRVWGLRFFVVWEWTKVLDYGTEGVKKEEPSFGKISQHEPTQTSLYKDNKYTG